MQSNSSASGPLTALSACGGEEDEREISKLVGPTGAASNLAALNLSLNCWLHILSKESSMDLHPDSANLAVGSLTVDTSVEIYTSHNAQGFTLLTVLRCLYLCVYIFITSNYAYTFTTLYNLF